MLVRRNRHALDDMRYRAPQAIVIGSGCTREDLETDRLLAPALQYALIVVGEAAASSKRAGSGIRRFHGGASWMRNVMVHGYDKTNLGIVWRAVTSDLRALVTELDRNFETGFRTS